MPGRECYHCKQWIEKGEPHDCWTTTEAVLTEDLSEDLREAWERLRETAAAFGDQRIYASHSSIMFSRTSCYFFVRPKRTRLEVCIFLGRGIKSPQVKRVVQASRSKRVNLVYVTHRDQVEAPLTDWLQEAYEFNAVARTRRAPGARAKTKAKARRPAAPATKPARRTKRTRR